MNLYRKVLAYIRKRPLDCFLILVFSIAIIILYSLYFSVNLDDGHWDQFKRDNNCKLLLDDYGNKRLSWKCDDGKTYYRWMQQR